MKALKIALIAVAVYIGIVVAFESMIGFFQPANASTIVITTIDDGGASHDRVVSRIDHEGRLYVAANHWPRAWYRRALERPDVRATGSGGEAAYRAVAVDGAEHDELATEYAHGIVFKILTGFPPRRFLRLDPAT